MNKITVTKPINLTVSLVSFNHIDPKPNFNIETRIFFSQNNNEIRISDVKNFTCEGDTIDEVVNKIANSARAVLEHKTKELTR